MATQINLTTGSGTSSISLSTGARGPAGADGAAGAAGTNGTNGSDATVTAANVVSAMSDFDGTQAASARLAIEINGVIVSKKDGTRKGYAPSADTDTARGLALEAAFAAAVAGDTIDLSPGNYYVAKATSSILGIVSQFGILNKMTIRLNGARLYKKATDTASCMFMTTAASGIDEWSIIGPGVLDGSYASNSDTAARGSSAAEIGIEVLACRKVRIQNVTIRNFAGSGILGNAATFAADSYSGGGSNKISTVHISGCNIDLNNRGIEIYQGNEYWQIIDTTLNKNQTAIDDYYAGNLRMTGGEITNNVTGLLVRHAAAQNSGHGQFVGVAINHNTGFAVQVQASMLNGFIFTGCNLYADSATTNKIESLGGGVQFVGCTIDSPFYASATPSGLNYAKSCHFPIGAVSAAAAIADLSAAERAKWKFVNNHTLAGTWASDDIRTTYADDAAAGTGGVLAGELWHQTTTGVVFVKQ